VSANASPARSCTPATAQLAEALGGRANGHGWTACCPAHEDSTPSLSISEGANGKVLLKCHAGCTQLAVIEALQNRGVWPKPTSTGLTVAELAAAKALPESLLHESGFSDDEVKGYPVIRMVYRGADGRQILCTRYRGGHEKETGKTRFWFRRGDKQQLFGLWRLQCEAVIVVEGETDAVALWAAGFNAIGVPGAKAWNDKRFAAALENCSTIFVHVESDEGGQQFRAAFEHSMLKERVRFFTCAPQAKDPCELRAQLGEAFKGKIDTLLADATSGAASNAAEPAPAPAPVDGVLPTIEVRDGELPRLVQEAEQVLLARGGIYQRAQQLVHIVELDKSTQKEGIRREAGSLMIMCVERDRMRLELAKAAGWWRYDERKKKWCPTDPPVKPINSLLANVGAWKLPALTGIIAAPTLRRDGSLLAAPGYDPGQRPFWLLRARRLPADQPHADSRGGARSSCTAQGSLQRMCFRARAARSE
jgi:hypothetical protein